MARKKGINNKNRNLKKKYIYFFMEGSKNCSEDKYIREYYNQFQDRAVDIGFKFISCGDGSWKNIEKEINKEKRNINDEKYNEYIKKVFNSIILISKSIQY